MIRESGRRIAITGATGLVGSALATALRAGGDQVIPISRRPTAGGVRWDPVGHSIDVAALQGIDALVHLAGESIAGGRWTDARKSVLRDSRIGPTRWLAELLRGLSPRPAAMISASAIGYYGDRGDELLTEEARPGNDFLARLAADWEDAADPARQAGIRVVHPRFGIILARQGGALAKMLPPFRLGLGGPMGSGRQWMSWIAIDDVVGAIAHLIAADGFAGPVNFAAPEPVRNAEFAQVLAAALRRPAILPVPAFALRALFGEMADVALLASQRASAQHLIETGYGFLFPTLDAALRKLLGD